MKIRFWCPVPAFPGFRIFTFTIETADAEEVQASEQTEEKT